MRHLAILLACLVAPPLNAVQSPPAARPPGDGRITGRVLTSSGAPIEGVTVSTLHFTEQPRAEHRYTATSGADGGYQIDGLPAGTFRVVARKLGYSGMTTHPGQIGEGVVVRLDAGAAMSGIDIVLRPTGTIAGRVRRPDGTPVAKAMVWVQIRQPDGKFLGVQAPFTTGQDGVYRLENVPQGSYAIMANYSARHEMIGKAEPAEYEDWARTFHPAATTFEDATPVEIRGGDSYTSIDITLQPDPRFSVTGVVVDGQGQTPRNAKLQFGSATLSGGANPFMPDGQFMLRGIGNGPVHLLASADSDEGVLVGFATVEVQGASISGARIVVGKPARVSGRLSTDGAAFPADARIRVVLAPPWPRSGAEEEDGSPVHADGSFRTAGIIGPRVVRVSGLPPRWGLKEVRRAGRILPDAQLTLANGQRVDDLEVVITSRN